MLGIAERTLRLHAERGRVARRRDGRAVLYLVTPATHAGMPVAVANVTAATPATPATDTGNASELVAALIGAVERATRAELENERLRAELATAHKGWARAHAGWKVATAALDRLTSA